MSLILPDWVTHQGMNRVEGGQGLHECFWAGGSRCGGCAAAALYAVQALRTVLVLTSWMIPASSDEKKKRTTIFSVHVHPDGSRLATAGLGTHFSLRMSARIQSDEMLIWTTCLSEQIPRFAFGLRSRFCTRKWHRWKGRISYYLRSQGTRVSVLEMIAFLRWRRIMGPEEGTV